VIPNRVPTAIEPWPPLITIARHPRWVTIRDVVLTLLAWCVVFWLCSGLFNAVNDFVHQRTTIPTKFDTLWEELPYFVLFAAVLVVLLAVSAALDRQRVRGQDDVQQPVPLGLAEQAERAGIGATALAEARQLKVLHVDFGERGAIAALRGVPTETPPMPARNRGLER